LIFQFLISSRRGTSATDTQFNRFGTTRYRRQLPMQPRIIVPGGGSARDIDLEPLNHSESLLIGSIGPCAISLSRLIALTRRNDSGCRGSLATGACAGKITLSRKVAHCDVP
jgi:hypothetical protein